MTDKRTLRRRRRSLELVRRERERWHENLLLFACGATPVALLFGTFAYAANVCGYW